VSPDWMVNTDRKDAMSAFERLLGDGGCLVLCGQPDAGHYRLARHLCARAESDGHTVLTFSRVGVPAPAKQVLLDVWEKASPPPAKHVVPRWNAPGSKLPLAEIVNATSAALRRLSEDVVLVVETPDRYDGYSTSEALAFPEVASQSGCPVLVTSLAPCGRWNSLDGCEVVELTEFSRDDILEVMIAQPFVQGMRLEQVVAACDAILNGQPRIPPEEAYALLRAWAEQ
jgi:hypothetical protein